MTDRQDVPSCGKDYAVKKIRKAYREGKLTDFQAARAQELGIRLGDPESLKSARPDLAAEWHPTRNGDLKPSDVTAGSHKKVWWLGECGHEWEQGIMNRTRLGRGCPYCDNRAVLPGFNDLASKYPEIAAEWHPTKNGGLRPERVNPGTSKKVWWRCAEGHEWQATVNNRTRFGKGCRACNQQREVVNIETGERFDSIAEAASAYPGSKGPRPTNILRALKDPTRTAYGSHWRYAEEKDSR